jgi:hypothetical protein
MRPNEDTTDPQDAAQDAKRAAWIEDLPLSDPIFDDLFPRLESSPPRQPAGS